MGKQQIKSSEPVTIGSHRESAAPVADFGSNQDRQSVVHGYSKSPVPGYRKSPVPGYKLSPVPFEGGYQNPTLNADGTDRYAKTPVPFEGGYNNATLNADGTDRYAKTPVPFEGGYQNEGLTADGRNVDAGYQNNPVSGEAFPPGSQPRLRRATV